MLNRKAQSWCRCAMGITESDTLFMSSYGNGPSGSTAVVACDLIGMTGAVDYACENVYDPLLPIANSNDPYIYSHEHTNLDAY